MELIVGLGFTVLLLALGWTVGCHREQKHIGDLDIREFACRDMLVTQLRSFPLSVPGEDPPRLIAAEAIIATDYLKTFLANLRNLIGGELKSYQSLLIRARREAILRVLEEARREGYNAVCNLRLDSADIGGNTNPNSGGNRGMVMASILASGTAYHAKCPPVKQL